MAHRILLVEDEVLIAMLIEEMLEELGHDVVATAARLPAALALAQDCEVDFALLDLNLDGEASFPVAEILQQRGIPFAFATGYSDTILPPAFESITCLRKPFSKAELSGVTPALS